MTLAWLSVGALVLAVTLSCTTTINVGVLSMAMALVNNLMTNGVLVDYDCSRNTAWVNRAVWTKYNFEQRRNMLIGLATVCDTRRAGYRISVVDYDSKREIAAFDGRTVRME